MTGTAVLHGGVRRPSTVGGSWIPTGGHVWQIAVTVGGIDGDNGGVNNGWRALRGIRMGREDVRVEAMGAYSVLLVTVICLRHTSRGDLKTGGWGVARQPSEGDPVTEMTGAGLVIT